MPFGKNVKNVYKGGEDAKCAVWLYPYRSYDLVGRLKHWTKHRKNRKDRISDINMQDIFEVMDFEHEIPN